MQQQQRPQQPQRQEGGQRWREKPWVMNPALRIHAGGIGVGDVDRASAWPGSQLLQLQRPSPLSPT